MKNMRLHLKTATLQPSFLDLQNKVLRTENRIVNDHILKILLSGLKRSGEELPSLRSIVS